MSHVTFLRIFPEFVGDSKSKSARSGRRYVMQQGKKEAIQAEMDKVLTEGDEAKGIEIIQGALDKDLSASTIFLEVIQPLLDEIGKRFERLEIFLPELMKAAKVVKAIHKEVLEPAIRSESGEAINVGTVVIGTVKGDIHDIGKNLVALMLQVNGFEVIDLGTDVPTQVLINAARDNQADIIGLSSLLTPSMPYMGDLVARLEGLGLRDQFRVVVGGAPVTDSYAQHIGADAYGADAIDAVRVCLAQMDGAASA
jgi:methylmalonyl-CoA mutase cobalamin-binding domain/chain